MNKSIVTDPMVAVLSWIIVLLPLILLTGCEQSGAGNNEQPRSKASAATSGLCDIGPAKSTDGLRRLALVVGVGQYKNPQVPDLKGPPNDARRFYDLLTGKNGYGFPEENVCLLLDENANTQNFKEAFNKGLVDRAQPGDVAVVFFAGHGSQATDKNRDEPDHMDETLMLHDSRSDGIRDLVDDEFHQMLARLHGKTRHITVIIDACNAGTATRGQEAGTTMARFFTPLTGDTGPDSASEGGDGDGKWNSQSLTGMVVLTAATDSNPALEKNGRGIFTDALLKVMNNVGSQPLTYAQVARQVPSIVAAESPQVPYFHGDLSRIVMGNKNRQRPVSWDVIAVGPPVEIGGPPLPGIGKGAEFRIYDGAVTGVASRNPANSKATVVVTEMTGLNAKAEITTAKQNTKILPGDIAVLARPGNDFIRLTVRLRPVKEAGGIAPDRAATLREMVVQNPSAKLVIDLVDGPGDFELSVAADNRLVLKGPENTIRNKYPSDNMVSESLWRHARQRALLQLQGEGGEDFVDGQTLQVELVPAPANKQNRCSAGKWQQAAPNTEQVVPLCYAWNVKVTLAREASIPLLIGALILSTDGSIYALPADDRKIRLNPGEKHVFDDANETFMGMPPLDVQDRILVFGTQETNQVAWSQFTRGFTGRGPASSGLERALRTYFSAGQRGIGAVDDGPVEDTTWTMSTLTARVEANSRFLKTEGRTGAPFEWREYTLAKFDVRPYLPEDPTSALYRLLTKADWLARASIDDGFGYKQHDWSQSSDEENLKLGIDCSRAIWFAFTRADLPYNVDNHYLTTAMMVDSDSAMKHNFDSCMDEPELLTGDILVYRDETRGDGHVVMVIDSERRIAWGSHGWDGTPGVLPVPPDTGVEYQKIKFKQDWERWDRKTMLRKACWRYRQIAEEAQLVRGQPGTLMLENTCDPKLNCGR